MDPTAFSVTPRSPLRERALQRLRQLNIENSESEEELVKPVPFEIDRDFLLSNDVSSSVEQKTITPSKSLQLPKESEPELIHQRLSYDLQDLEGNAEIESSIDSSLLQGSPRMQDEAALDPLETSEDSIVQPIPILMDEDMESLGKASMEVVTVISLRRPGDTDRGQADPSAGFFICEEPYRVSGSEAASQTSDLQLLSQTEKWLYRASSGKEAKGLRLIGAFARYLETLRVRD